MTAHAWTLLAAFTLILLACAWPLGAFMAAVLEGRRTFLSLLLGRVERACYRVAGVDPHAEMTWRGYAGAMLAINLVGMLAVYALQRLQGGLPLNPQHFAAVSAHSLFNTAVSFATNTNWQG